MATINVDIVSAEGEIFSGEAAMVFAPAKMGEVGIAPRHAPLLTALKPGEVRVQDTEGKEHFFYITGGGGPCGQGRGGQGSGGCLRGNGRREGAGGARRSRGALPRCAKTQGQALGRSAERAFTDSGRAAVDKYASYAGSLPPFLFT
jgi:hypothetical protein